MGSQVIAICECGVNSEILIGCGMLSYNEIDYFPGFCENCNEVVQINLKDEFSICKGCLNHIAIPYNSPQLIGTVGKEVIDRTFNNALTNGNYYCPSCKI